jgi:hypothetical protein
VLGINDVADFAGAFSDSNGIRRVRESRLSCPHTIFQSFTQPLCVVTIQPGNVIETHEHAGEFKEP